MARNPVTVELEDSLVEAARSVAGRTGVPETELYERGLREILLRDFAELMDEIATYQAKHGLALSDDEALSLASSEMRAMRTPS
jgi:hypothetical protein